MSEVSKKKKAAKPKETKSTASASTKPVDDGNAITAAQAQPKQTASGLAALTGHYQAVIVPEPNNNQKSIIVSDAIISIGGKQIGRAGDAKDSVGKINNGGIDATIEIAKQEDVGFLLDYVSKEDDVEVLGAMEVSSRSDNGFWRSGVHFSRTEKTVVVVVSDDDIKNPELSQSGLGIESAFPVVFMAPSQAKRVHDEPHLKVEVLELESLIGE